MDSLEITQLQRLRDDHVVAPKPSAVLSMPRMRREESRKHVSQNDVSSLRQAPLVGLRSTYRSGARRCSFVAALRLRECGW